MTYHSADVYSCNILRTDQPGVGVKEDKRKKNYSWHTGNGSVFYLGGCGFCSHKLLWLSASTLLAYMKLLLA